MEKLLITGASGLLGRAILRDLNQYNEYSVYALTTNQDKLKEYSNVNIVECDLTKESERRKILRDISPDICIHLAWDQTSSGFRNSDTNFLWLNISVDLLMQFHKNGGRRFLFAGSSSEYDGTNGTFDECVDVAPKSLYGLCKKSFSELGKEYSENNNMSFVSMRYFTIFGKEDKHDFGAIPYIISRLENNEKVICNAPKVTRDYIYVEDASKITLKILKSNFEGIINVASGSARSMEETFGIIAKLFGKEHLLEINKENSEEMLFNADISLLRSLDFDLEITDFSEAIKKEYLE